MKPAAKPAKKEWEALFDEVEVAMGGDCSDGLGGARGVWSATKLVAGVVMGFAWAGGFVRATRAGDPATILWATAWGAVAILAFNLLGRDYPQNRWTGISVTLIALCGFFSFVWG